MARQRQQPGAKRSEKNSGLPHEDSPVVQVAGDFEGLTDAQLAGAMPRGTVVSGKPPLGAPEQPLDVRDYAWRSHQHGASYKLLVQFVLAVVALGPEAEKLHLQRQQWDALLEEHRHSDPSAGDQPFDLETLQELAADVVQPKEPSTEELEEEEDKGDGEGTDNQE